MPDDLLFCGPSKHSAQALDVLHLVLSGVPRLWERDDIDWPTTYNEKGQQVYPVSTPPTGAHFRDAVKRWKQCNFSHKISRSSTFSTTFSHALAERTKT